MGCIRIERILDYLIEPLRRGIKDSSPYVRKTSALCIAKIFDLNPEVGADCGFLEILQELLLNDSNPMVISNVIAALADIHELIPDLEALKLNEEIVKRLVVVLGDCTEWGQVFIMDTLSDYENGVILEIEKMIETVIPKLQHANQAVVMSAINLLVKQGLQSRVLPENHQLRTVIQRKLSSPLISILSPPNPPEIQYAALRNVNLLVQIYPKLFTTEIGVFFCNYNDPQYVKLEKLQIIGLIVDDGSIDRILPELCEYAKDVDPEIVKNSIKVLSKCALSVPRWSDRIREIFMELLETQLPTVVQQVTVNLVPLLRTSETCRESFYFLLESFYFIDLRGIWEILSGDPSSQTALIWILGEFCNPLILNLSNEQIYESLKLFEEIGTSDSFKLLEGIDFQNQIILASLKLLILNHQSSLEIENYLNFDFLSLTKRILKKGLEEGESVDLRDCCRIYERILNQEISLKSSLASSSASASAFNYSNPSTPTLTVNSPAIKNIDDWGYIETTTDASFSSIASTDNSHFTLEKMILMNRENELDKSDDDNDDDDNEKNTRKSYEQIESVKILKNLISQLTKLSSIYHQLPGEFVSSRVIMKEEPGQSPLERSIKFLSLSKIPASPSMASMSTPDLPLAFTKLLRSIRPAVTNLLDLSYDDFNCETEKDQQISSELVDKIKISSPVDKYANLLDLLD